MANEEGKVRPSFHSSPQSSRYRVGENTFSAQSTSPLRYPGRSGTPPRSPVGTECSREKTNAPCDTVQNPVPESSQQRQQQHPVQVTSNVIGRSTDTHSSKLYLSPDSGQGVTKSPSLQRIHQQSSTETSGLGESIILGFSSQESVRSALSACYNERNEPSETTSRGRRTTTPRGTIGHSGNKSFNPEYHHYPHRHHQQHHYPRQEQDFELHDFPHGKFPGGQSIEFKTTSSHSVPQNQQPMRVSDWTDTKPLITTTEPKPTKRKSESSGTGTSPSTSVRTVVGRESKPKPSTSTMYPDDTDFDKLFTNCGKSQSNNLSTTRYKTRDGEDYKFDRHAANRGSTKSQLSLTGSFRSRSGSFRSRSGSNRRFLGTQTESAWTRWSKARRDSFRRRLELPENAKTEPTERASTPIKKAREEGLMFIHDDLKGDYISEEDINYIRRHRLERYKMFHVIEKSNKKKLRNFHSHTEMHISMRDWRILASFWQHHVFSRARYAAFFFAIISIVFIIVSVTSPQWIIYVFRYEEAQEFLIREGLWTRCVFYSAQNISCDSVLQGFKTGIWDSCGFLKNTTDINCEEKHDWQKAVIGLMIFSASFGLLATILALFGVCTSPLPKKIYYFHSAGEIFLVCALSVTVALVIYPTVMELGDNILSHYYGAGYGLGWGASAFFLVAALCMMLDDIVRETTRLKCCKVCFGSRQTDRQEHPV